MCDAVFVDFVNIFLIQLLLLNKDEYNYIIVSKWA